MSLSPNAKKISQLWEDVRNDHKPLRWVVARGNDTSSDLEVAGSGTSGLQGLVKALSEMNGVLFGGLRCAAVDNRGNVRSIRHKFVRFTLITEGVPPLRRAKAANFQALIDNIFTGIHVSFNISDATDLTPKELERKLQASAGAHLPNHYDFEGTENEAVPPTQTDVDDPPTPATPPCSPASPPHPSKAAARPPEEKLPPASKPSFESANAASEQKTTPAPTKSAPAPVIGSPSIESAWNRVQDDKDPANFVVVTCDGRNASSAKVVACQKGDLQAFKDCFEDDQVMFGGFRLRALDDRGNVVSVRAKFFFVSFIGKNVKPLIRAQAGQLKGKFENIFNGTHLSLAISDADELQESELTTKFLSAGGAHVPNKFDYSGTKSMAEESAK